MTTCYITFGQRYREETHPIDERAHPDGWFEFRGDTYYGALLAAKDYFMADDGYGHRLPLYAFDYDEEPDRRLYGRGCLARFNVVRGKTTEVKA